MVEIDKTLELAAKMFNSEDEGNIELFRLSLTPIQFKICQAWYIIEKILTGSQNYFSYGARIDFDFCDMHITVRNDNYTGQLEKVSIGRIVRINSKDVVRLPIDDRYLSKNNTISAIYEFLKLMPEYNLSKQDVIDEINAGSNYSYESYSRINNERVIVPDGKFGPSNILYVTHNMFIRAPEIITDTKFRRL